MKPSLRTKMKRIIKKMLRNKSTEVRTGSKDWPKDWPKDWEKVFKISDDFVKNAFDLHSCYFCFTFENYFL